MTQTTTISGTSLDALGVAGLTIGFVIAGLAPIALVTIYRLVRVQARCAEIGNVMKAAFGRSDDKIDPNDPKSVERKAAREALDSNPYISDLDAAFSLCHSWRQYFFPSLLLLTLNVALVAVLYAWVRIQLQPNWAGGPISKIPIPIIMALAGGYVWSLYQIISRVRSDELGPSDLNEISLGLLSCAPIGYVFSLLTLEAKGLPAFGAFAASSFPVREATRTFQEQALKKTLGSETTRTVRPNERNLGTAIDGVSDQTLVRLAELRIVTVLDMAYSDPIKVMLQSGYALPLVIDWMDQSIWALYVGDLRSEMVKMGLRCSLDVYEFVELHGLWDKVNQKRGVPEGSHKEALDAIAAKLSINANLLQDLFLRIYSDPQVIVLRRLWYVNGAPRPMNA
jgi:hypothetical protein